jgi:ATP-dependent helicase/nuclease subunit B
MIVEAGGFEGVPAAAVTALRYLKLTGGDPPGEALRAHDDPASAIEDIRDDLARLIASYDDPSQPYKPQPDPEIAPRYSDYDHLARLAKGSGRGGGA